MDCFWVTHAGQDPVEYFQKYPGRFPLLHIKDMKDHPAPTQDYDAKMGVFAPVGQGTIDWKRIFAAARHRRDEALFRRARRVRAASAGRHKNKL